MQIIAELEGARARRLHRLPRLPHPRWAPGPQHPHPHHDPAGGEHGELPRRRRHRGRLGPAARAARRRAPRPAGCSPRSGSAAVSSAAAAAGCAWMDGRRDAQVSALDRGLHYGDGLFETLACVAGHAALPRPAPASAWRPAARVWRCRRRTARRWQHEIGTARADCRRAILKLIVTRGAGARARLWRQRGAEQPHAHPAALPRPLPEERGRAGGRARAPRASCGSAENPRTGGHQAPQPPGAGPGAPRVVGPRDRRGAAVQQQRRAGLGHA